MTPQREMLLADLTRQTYTPVPFPLSHREIEEAVGKFFAFLALPQEQKDVISKKWLKDGVHDMGYIRTKGDKDVIGKKDFKEYFHYHPDARKEWGREAAAEPVVAAFFEAADALYAYADRVGKEVISTLDPEFPGLYDAFFPAEWPGERILRFLKYDNRGEGEFLARGHYDRGGCTLAIAESAPGLRIGKDDATLTPVVHQDSTALFFPALHFAELTERRVPAAWHDVVQAEGQSVSGDAARWAVVYFMNAPGLPVPTGEETHIPVR